MCTYASAFIFVVTSTCWHSLSRCLTTWNSIKSPHKVNGAKMLNILTPTLRAKDDTAFLFEL